MFYKVSNFILLITLFTVSSYIQSAVNTTRLLQFQTFVFCVWLATSLWCGSWSNFPACAFGFPHLQNQVIDMNFLCLREKGGRNSCTQVYPVPILKSKRVDQLLIQIDTVA